MPIKRFTLLAMALLSYSAARAQNVQTNNQGVIINQVIVPAYSTRPSDGEVLRRVLEDQRNRIYPAYELPAARTNATPAPYLNTTSSFEDLGYMMTTVVVNLRKAPSTKAGLVTVLPKGFPVKIPPGTLLGERLSPGSGWVNLTFYNDKTQCREAGYTQLKFLTPASL